MLSVALLGIAVLRVGTTSAALGRLKEGTVGRKELAIDLRIAIDNRPSPELLQGLPPNDEPIRFPVPAAQMWLESASGDQFLQRHAREAHARLSRPIERRSPAQDCAFENAGQCHQWQVIREVPGQPCTGDEIGGGIAGQHASRSADAVDEIERPLIILRDALRSVPGAKRILAGQVPQRAGGLTTTQTTTKLHRLRAPRE